MDFAKKFGDTVLDVQLDKITKVWKEGFIIKKVCITADTTDGQKTFKFGVLGQVHGSNQYKTQKRVNNLHQHHRASMTGARTHP